MNGGVALLELDGTINIKHSYRLRHYVPQNVLILNAAYVTCMMEHSSPFMVDPVPTVNRHMTTVCAGRHILRVITLSPRFVN